VTRFFLVRHAESQWNAEGRWQGRGDPSLSPHGREQASIAVERIRGEVDLIVASPQRRAIETAEIIAGALGLGEVKTDDGLREIDVGEWTGLTMDEVKARWGAELEAWRAGELDSPPGGEDRMVFLERVLAALERLRQTHGDTRVLVVTHGGVIGRVERYLERHPGRGSGNLTGRWFELDGELLATSERIPLLPEPEVPAPETR
jgi:probable phosphoglycerate mutase